MSFLKHTKALLIGSIVLCAVGLVIYGSAIDRLNHNVRAGDILPSHTKINNIDVSHLSKDEVQRKVAKHYYQKRTLKTVTDDGFATGFSKVPEQTRQLTQAQLEQVFSPRWTITRNYHFKLNQAILGASTFDNNDKAWLQKTVNILNQGIGAKLETTADTVTITDHKASKTGHTRRHIDYNNTLASQKVQLDNSSRLTISYQTDDKLDKVLVYLNQNMTLEHNGDKKTVKILDLISSGKVTARGASYKVDTTKVSQWLKPAQIYVPYGQNFKYTTVTGENIMVPNSEGSGFRYNDNLAKAMITGALASNKNSVNLDDATQGNNLNPNASKRIEIDLENLNEYLIDNGKAVKTIKVMSGTLSGSNKTPKGLFGVLYKQTPAVLKGFNNDGSKYASPVNYWVPITQDGVGLHDSPWQPASVYGQPSVRDSYHSHGCLNNPPSEMKAVFDFAEQNMPVVIY